MPKAEPHNQHLAQLYQEQSAKVLATLVRLLGDFDLAEEAMHEAFSVALQAWKENGIPANPTAWLISTGRFKAIDSLRRKKRLAELEPDIQQLITDLEEHNKQVNQQEIEDDQLRMIFTCCHPAIDIQVQIPLTLREVCGLTTEEIASAYLVTPATMAQRIVRGKNKIKRTNIPFVIPQAADLPDRIDAVLTVIYLIFNEGYAASSGHLLCKVNLSNEAIRLCRLVLSLLPDSEVMGLLALMLLHESRREARVDTQGNIVLLAEQNRALWRPDLIAEGIALVQQALATQNIGTYTIQAAIASIHAQSTTSTDWQQIIELYDLLMKVDPSPVVELNRAVAVAMHSGPQAGLKIIEEISAHGELDNYHKLYSTQGELLARIGELPAAIKAFEMALSIVKQAPEKRYLQQKLTQLKKQ
ncbi:RNA polymerase sigma factor [Thalassotalea agariperforans]